MNVRMTVLVGAGVLGFALPPEIKPSIKWQQVGKNWDVTNTGNVNILFSACKATSDCEDSDEGGRLYPNRTKRVTVSGKKIKIMRELPGGGSESFIVSKPAGTKKFTGVADKKGRRK